MHLLRNLLLSIVILILCLPVTSGAATDQKPDEYFILLDPGRMDTAIALIINTTISTIIQEEQEELSVYVLEERGEELFNDLNREHENVGAVISLIDADTSSKEPVIHIFHYPFGSITEHHVISPKYSFKFGSDSALLGIQLYEHLNNQEVILKPADFCIEGFTLPLLQKWTALSVPYKSLSDTETARAFASKIANSILQYYRYDGNAVVGLIPPEAQKHASFSEMEVILYPYIYPDREFTEEEQKERRKIMSTKKQKRVPLDSGLYYFTDLDPLTPYSLEIKNVAGDASPYWDILDSPSFVTSSVRGIVRTVPGEHSNYEPLQFTEKKPLYRAEHETFDYIVENATIIDGNLKTQKYQADVGISGSRIAAIGDLKKLPRNQTIDGSGKYLTPGFIDIHSHGDRGVLNVSYAPSHVRQGITTILGGNCSFSPLGIGNFLRKVEANGTPVNIAMLVGNRPIRQQVLGRRTGMFAYSELYRQKELIDLAMEEGAFGMSTGLIYAISEEAFAWELAELSKQMKPYNGFYASHIRGETDEVLDAVREAIHIGEMAEVPVQISHMKILRKRNWGIMNDYLRLMEEARARGVDVTGDQYPWEASGPAAHYHLHRLLVQEAIRNGHPEVVRLKDMPGKYEKYSGKNLVELLEGENMTPEELIDDLDLQPDSPIYATFLCIGDEDIILAMKDEHVMVCTDANMTSLETIESGDAKNHHPRIYRTYHQFFAHYVRDREIIPWELAVYKCTGLPADRMGLVDRGRIQVGAYADLVLFDPEKIDPVADFRDQTPPPVGFDWVFTNGVPVIKEGLMTRERPGKALYAGNRRKP